MDNTADLRVLLASPATLVMAETHEEERFMGIVARLAAELDLSVWTWSTASGLSIAGGPSMHRTQNPHQALAWLEDVSGPAVFVFVDAHPILSDPYVVRRIKETAGRLSPDQTLVLTAPSVDVPPELVAETHVWRLKPPGLEELTALVHRTAADLRARSFPVSIDDDSVPALAEALRGLSIAQAERVVQQAAFADGALGAADLPAIRTAKAEILMTDGILELVEADVGTLDDVGGLGNLKEWLAVRTKAQRVDAGHLGLAAPRGILLTGVPGCGKSFVAKTLARTWGQPLILLDPGRLYSKYIGESEQRLAQALEAVDAMAPAVLWIDEIEKGFADGGEDGGTSRRIFGTFLRWLQERPDGVFVVATANDVSALPPELQRKGRLDEIFFVDLPDEAARHEIIEHHLSVRSHDLADFDVAELVGTSAGFSGAEIEAAIVGGTYRAFAADRPLDQTSLITELTSTVPLSVARAEDIRRLRAWAAEKAVAA